MVNPSRFDYPPFGIYYLSDALKSEPTALYRNETGFKNN